MVVVVIVIVIVAVLAVFRFESRWTCSASNNNGIDQSINNGAKAGWGGEASRLVSVYDLVREKVGRIVWLVPL